MKNKKLKTLSLLVLATILTSSVVGCTKPAATVESTPTPTPEVKYDFGGKTITIGRKKDLTPGLDKTTDALIARIAEVEKKFNVKIAYNAPTGDVMTGIMAGTPGADILTATDANFYGYYYGGAMAVLNDDKTVDFTKSKWDTTIKDNFTINNKIYAMYPESSIQANVIVFNKRLIKELNLTDPYELVKTGKWNTDTFVEMAKKATLDKNGDGKFEQWGFASWGAHHIALMLMANSGANVIEKVNGKPKFIMDSPAAIDALNTMQKWYTVDKFVYTGTADFLKDFKAGNIAMFMGPASGLGGLGDMKDEYGVVMPPMNPKNKEYTHYSIGLSYNFIPATTKTPVNEILRVYDALTEPLFPGQTPADEIKIKYENFVKDTQSLQTVSDAFLKTKSIYMPIMLYGFYYSKDPNIQILPEMFNAIKDGNVTPKETIDAKKSAIQTYLDTTYNK